MRYRIIFILLVACEYHPKNGDVYENKLTRERVEVDVGECYSLKETQNIANNWADSLEKRMIKAGYTQYNKLTEPHSSYRSIVSICEDSTAMSVGYEYSGRAMVLDGGRINYGIVEVEKFEKKFTLVE